MANKSQSQDQQSGASSGVLESITQLQDAGFGNMMGMGTAWLEAVGKMNVEMVIFVASRMTEDAKTQQKILECRSVGDLSHLQAQFMQRATDQYKAETGKLVELGNSALGHISVGKLVEN